MKICVMEHCVADTFFQVQVPNNLFVLYKGVPQKIALNRQENIKGVRT